MSMFPLPSSQNMTIVKDKFKFYACYAITPRLAATRDVKVAFDNEQTICKKYRVCATEVSAASVICSRICHQMNSEHQFTELPAIRYDDRSKAALNRRDVGTYRLILSIGDSEVARLNDPSKLKCCPHHTHFEDIVSEHAGFSPSIQECEPIMLNPNSVPNVRAILDIMKTEFNVGNGPGQRRWLIVTMDGAPYLLLRKLQAETGTLYDWVVPEMGLGHCEIILKRTWLQLNWEAMVKKAADLLGFKTARALAYAYACNDNHKSWDFIYIAYQALLAELISATSSQTSSFKTLLDKCRASGNPSVVYWGEQLWYLHNIITFRGGVRRNQYELIFTSLKNLLPLVFSRFHPKYHEILLHTLFLHAAFPHEVRADYDACASVSLRGNPTAGEGFDFILEMYNKAAKKFLTGDVSYKQWKRAFRMLPEFRELRSMYMDFLNVADPSEGSSRRVPCKQKEVSIVRAMIRESGALSADTTTLCGFTDAKLPPSLLQINQQGRNNLQQCVENMCKNANHRLRFIYSSDTEENLLKTINATTKAELKNNLVPAKLQALRVTDLQAYDRLCTEWEDVKLGTKRIMVDFYVNFDSKILTSA